MNSALPAVASRIFRPQFGSTSGVPRVQLFALGLALACALAVDAWKLPLETAAVVLSIAAGVTLGNWLEESSFQRFSTRPPWVRALALGATFWAFIPVAMVALLGGLLPSFAGQVFVSACFVTALWVASASVGSAIVFVLDVVLSAIPTTFRTRLTVAIMGLVALSAAFGIWVGAVVLALTELARAKELEGTLDLDGVILTKAQLMELISSNAPSVMLLSGELAAAFALPALFSASSKLAEAAMARVRPLIRALDEVGRGARDVRVEEAGSVDFIALNKQFNSMVASLQIAERMEDAFGRYVSKKVFERIRSQHGEANLPAQLREATVFFADVRGYTAMSEKLAPEQVVDVLNRYLERVVALVDTHEGYLNKFIGDAVVVVFNGPIDQPDHAERGLRCAVALQQLVAQMNAEGLFRDVGDLRIGVGVATGPMVCGNVGGPSQMEYTVIGDTVNLAARLTSHAGPGEVWASEAAKRAAPGLTFETLPAIHVKGKADAVTPYRVGV